MHDDIRYAMQMLHLNVYFSLTYSSSYMGICACMNVGGRVR